MKINLCIDPILMDKLGKRGIITQVFDSILTHSEKQQMLEDLEVFASNWFLQDSQDITRYRHVSIGAAIHDDLLIFFYFFYHFCLILEKLEYKKNKVVFYQSVSCHLPEPVEGFLRALNIEVITTHNSYPYLCFRKAFLKEANARKVYSGIVYDLYSKTKLISTIRPTLRHSGYILASNILNAFYPSSKETIYVRPMRRLQTILTDYCSDKKQNDRVLNIQIPFPEIDIHSIRKDLNSTRRFSFIRKLVNLARRGIHIKPSIHMVSPIDGLLSRFFNGDQRKKQFETIVPRIPQSIKEYLKVNDEKIADVLSQEFEGFYFHHLSKFLSLIDKLNKDVRKSKVTNYLVEYVNPFEAQVLANYSKKVALIHISRFNNNQYFCKQLIEKVKGNFFIGATSAFEYERMLKQCLTQDMIFKANERYYKINKTIACKKHANNFLQGKTVLIIPPPARVLWTFRMLIESKFMEDFFRDIISALDLLGVSRVIIRPGPRHNMVINDLAYRLIDMYKSFYENVEVEKCEILMRNETTAESLDDDLKSSDLVIGTLSACAIDAALAGLDYVAYDKSVTPFPDSLNLTICSARGPIPVLSDKDSLLEYLKLYEPDCGKKLIGFIGPFSQPDSNMVPESLQDIFNQGSF